MTRIALISDIHFGKFSRSVEFSVPGEDLIDTSSGGQSLKESMVSLLKSQNIDYLCIAGDLTSQGSPQEFSYCENMVLDLAKDLNIPKNHILLSLGNHDTDWKISSLYEHFDSAHPDFPLKLVKEKYQKIAAAASRTNLGEISEPPTLGPAPYSGVIETDSFVMFMLNSGWCCTQDQEISRGQLEAVQLEWFEKESNKYRDLNKWKIVLMHHHPFNYSYPVHNADFSLLEEGSRFLEIAATNGFHLVLHGHRHHPRAETTQKNEWENPMTFICAGSFAVNASHRNGGSIPNTLHVIELTDEIGVLKLFNYEYTPTDGWIPFDKNRPAAPLDSKMMLGKLFSSEEITKAITKLSDIQAPIAWEDLDDCLHFMSFDKLNDRIRSHYSNSYRMIGLFPEDIFLFKK